MHAASPILCQFRASPLVDKAERKMSKQPFPPSSTPNLLGTRGRWDAELPLSTALLKGFPVAKESRENLIEEEMLELGHENRTEGKAR